MRTRAIMGRKQLAKRGTGTMIFGLLVTGLTGYVAYKGAKGLWRRSMGNPFGWLGITLVFGIAAVMLILTLLPKSQ